MIPAFLIPLAQKYAIKIGIGLLAAAVVVGVYFYWSAQIYHDGVMAERAKWEMRDIETARQSAEVLKLKQHENKLINEAQHKRSMGAIETYANYSNHLHKQLVDAKRVPNKTTAAGGNRNAMPGTGEDTCAPAGTSEEDVQTKLSIKAVELLIEQYLVPSAEVINEFN